MLKRNTESCGSFTFFFNISSNLEYNFDQHILAVFNTKYISQKIFEEKNKQTKKKRESYSCNEIGAGTKNHIWLEFSISSESEKGLVVTYIERDWWTQVKLMMTVEAQEPSVLLTSHQKMYSLPAWGQLLWNTSGNLK